MSHTARRIGAVLLSGSLALAVAATALATVSETGTKYCSSNYTPYTRSLSTGYTEHFPPGSGYNDWNNGAQWIVRKWYADHAGGGGWWGVYVTGGSLDDPGTYAGCQATGP
jgi:hypothetical protein